MACIGIGVKVKTVTQESRLHRRLFGSLSALALLGNLACSGPEFRGKQGDFELQTSEAAVPGEISSETALRCDCRFIGHYAGTDYWMCPLDSAECLVAEPD